MNRVPPLNRYSSRPGTACVQLLIVVQLVFMTVGAALARNRSEALVLVALQLVVLSGLLAFHRLNSGPFPELVYHDGHWAIRRAHQWRLDWITPEQQSAIFPMCLLLVYQDPFKRRRRLLIWQDVVGQEAYRQLCRQLHHYFFLVRKSQSCP